jgi:hypothetical protein
VSSASRVHVILDDSSSHATPEVRDWLAKHPCVHFHYTPTRVSWLHQVEVLFGILGKQSLRPTDFIPPAPLAPTSGDPCELQPERSPLVRSSAHRRMLDRISTAVHG